ncbi:MAG: phosphotransferase, partial [Mycobacterium sp.]
MTTRDDLARKLPEVLAPVLGTDAADVTIVNLRALTGGASRTTWAFDAVTGEGRRSLILRIGPPDDVHAGMELEARAQAAAAVTGAPVPHILAADDSPAALGNPFLICDEINGETIVRRIQRQLDAAGGQAARAGLLRQCAQALAAIHRADPHIPG